MILITKDHKTGETVELPIPSVEDAIKKIIANENVQIGVVEDPDYPDSGTMYSSEDLNQRSLLLYALQHNRFAPRE